MNNFGVIEVASTKTTHAPGWAYVPDTAASSVPSQSVSAVHLHVNRNKRAARLANSASGTGTTAAQRQDDLSARHDAKLQKEIEQLQRDSFGGGHHASQAAASGDGGGSSKSRGHTANVRKILASQKTFANHLDDFDAWWKTQVESGGAATGSAGHSAAGTPAPSLVTGAGSKRAAGGGGGPAQKKGGASGSRARGAGGNNKKAASAQAQAADPDVSMTDAPPVGEDAAQTDEQNEGVARKAQPESKVLTPFTKFVPPSHPGDEDPLLETWLPPLPTDDELRELMRAPPLNYHQAKGVWTEDDRRYPSRRFCEVCGYWGRVRCMKCGTRVCALDCLDVHREECITRYGL